MKSRYIAAVEIGSSKIKGTVAAVDPDGGVSVLAIEEADAGGAVRYGRVQNARETAERVSDLVRRLENNPRVAGAHISAVVIPEGGRSVQSLFAEATVRQGAEAEITAQTLSRLHKEARFNLATDRDVLVISPRRYVVDNSEVRKIVGTFGNVVRGEFTIVTASPENRRNLDRVTVRSGETDIPRQYIPRIIALADTVLSDADRQPGCLLIDFGAETTSLAVYRDGTLQLAATLPMGSANITRDLSSSLGITFDSAENIKMSKGEAVTERVKLAAPDAETREVINLVSARTGEIIANIEAYISRAGFKASDLSAGIIVAGGGARLRGFIEMLESQTKMKVRRAVADSSIVMPAGTNPTDHLDVIAPVRYAAVNLPELNCLEFPAGAPETQAAAEQHHTAAPAAQPTATAAGVKPTRRDISESDPNLLADDDFGNVEQPDNINVVDPEELPEPGLDANSTRRSLLNSIIKLFTAPKDEDDLDEE